MRILMFGWEFPPFNSGGLGVACLGLTRALNRLGVSVLFVLPKKLNVSSDACRFLFAEERSPLFRIKNFNSLLSPYLSSREYDIARKRGPHPFYGYGLLDEVMRYAMAVPKIIEGESFDIIHAHDWLSFPAGVHAKEISGKPLIVHVHATEFDRTGGHNINKDVYEIERKGMHMADEVVTVSNYTKNILVEKYQVSPQKISVVHNGIEESDFVFASSPALKVSEMKERGKKIVLFMGRITLQKGPDYLVKAAKRVLEHMKDVYFVISGSGDMQYKVMEEVARSGISDNFIFTHFARGEEVGKLYKMADLFILPSVSEPFGLTPLESLLCGTPVIISKQSGVSEVLKHALKTDFWDVDEMANKIVAILRHPPLKKELAEKGREEARKNTWQKAASKCKMIYNRIAN